MTGVSLAGTQLRVNTYNTQDAEWNDVQVRPPSYCYTYKVSKRVLTAGIATELARSAEYCHQRQQNNALSSSVPFPTTCSTERRCCTSQQNNVAFIYHLPQTSAMCLAYLTLVSLITLLMFVEMYVMKILILQISHSLFRILPLIACQNPLPEDT
jgi:hypothetical protein